MKKLNLNPKLKSKRDWEMFALMGVPASLILLIVGAFVWGLQSHTVRVLSVEDTETGWNPPGVTYLEDTTNGKRFQKLGKLGKPGDEFKMSNATICFH